MLYQLEQGQYEKKILQQCAKEKSRIPDKILNAPELCLGLEIYWQGFLDLTTCRNNPESEISWLTMLTYCKEKKITGEQKESFFYFIQHLDLEYLSWRRQEIKRQNNG